MLMTTGSMSNFYACMHLQFIVALKAEEFATLTLKTTQQQLFSDDLVAVYLCVTCSDCERNNISTK